MVTIAIIGELACAIAFVAIRSLQRWRVTSAPAESTNEFGTVGMKCRFVLSKGWRRNGQRFLIEFNRKPIGSIDKAFAANVAASGLDADVVPHTTRHSGITWLAIEGVDPYEICRYAGITMEVFEQVYAHHHPDFMSGVHRGFNRHRKGARKTIAKVQPSTNVTAPSAV